jgi:hypothetical protein
MSWIDKAHTRKGDAGMRKRGEEGFEIEDEMMRGERNSEGVGEWMRIGFLL